MTRRGYALLALAAAAFTVYGSLVPFRFHARSWDEAVKGFEWVLTHRAGVESRSDWAANVALGLPVGFGLLGALRTDKPGVGKAALTAFAVWPLCVLFAAAVEFAQLFVPGRTSSAGDIIAQGVGAALGMAGWLLFGPAVTRTVRAISDDPRSGGRAGRLLAAYVLVVWFVQLLPLDLSASPADLYRKVRDGRATVVPFADPPGRDLRTGEAEPRWRLTVKWAKLVALYLPAGLIASRLPRSTVDAVGGTAGVIGAGFGVALGIEATQLLVQSRYSSVTDVLFGGVGAAVGLAAGSLDRRWAWPLGVLWFAGLAVIDWLPFTFAGSPGPVEWVPLADLLRADYLRSADDLVLKVILFLPVGALVGYRRLAAVVGFAAAIVLEAGQVFIPARDASATDPVLAAVGAWVGAVAARRVMGVENPGRTTRTGWSQWP